MELHGPRRTLATEALRIASPEPPARSPELRRCCGGACSTGPTSARPTAWSTVTGSRGPHNQFGLSHFSWPLPALTTVSCNRLLPLLHGAQGHQPGWANRAHQLILRCSNFIIWTWLLVICQNHSDYSYRLQTNNNLFSN